MDLLYYLCSENKGADQLRGYIYAKNRFSYDAAHFYLSLLTRENKWNLKILLKQKCHALWAKYISSASV